MINSYPTVFAIGHKAIEGLFSGTVVVEEKVDGSQFSFGVIDGQLECRSKGKQLILDAPEKMFIKGVQSVREIETILHPDWIYRGEYLASPKHNTLAYNRVPEHNIIGFDIITSPETYLTPKDKKAEFDRIGLETAPTFYSGVVSGLEMFNDLLTTISILGGTKIEGVVVKNYELFTIEKKVAMGKYVSEAFKEIHEGDWKQRNPTGTDFITELSRKYKTPARWQKAVQHLKESGRLDGSPRDIGSLIIEVPEDIKQECEQEIKDALFGHFWPQLRRIATSGLPEWYKQELAHSAFEIKP